MINIKQNGELFSEDKKRELLESIIQYFHNERDEEIGVIAAESVLDFFVQTIGLELYNQGIEDSKSFMKSRFEDLELDMDSLLKKGKN